MHHPGDPGNCPGHIKPDVEGGGFRNLHLSHLLFGFLHLIRRLGPIPVPLVDLFPHGPFLVPGFPAGISPGFLLLRGQAVITAQFILGNVMFLAPGADTPPFPQFIMASVTGGDHLGPCKVHISGNSNGIPPAFWIIFRISVVDRLGTFPAKMAIGVEGNISGNVGFPFGGCPYIL